MSNDQIAVDSDVFLDEGYAESTSTSYLSSIASSILCGVDEKGRRYVSYGKALQGIPIDEKEQDRNDLQHAKFMLLLNGKLHLAPITEQPQNILDIGTGSGIWAIDIADKYPNSFDFIFGRELLMAIRDWPRVIQQAYDHLKPGGYLELEMTYPKTYCEDNSIDLETSAYAETSRLLFECGRRMEAPWEESLKWKDQFIATGFEDVSETILLIPIGRWPRDKDLKKPSSY
ncbi:S-adenosyl-L-methionine-dependent methyltransferase [Ampelomyces quisqualis]|uniref:S-adenosyl-L-methionine-dependent methyltransferase n=1 Tax=Ampelomyces quisqualis TaxID=50730 RepID=A0A6A5QI47_AMPQU|nr:S-adenosyl-L-methionine-dependent methyltransferase [Ampelomyces quisqualis]